jgi:predicted transcriptional regulator
MSTNHPADSQDTTTTTETTSGAHATLRDQQRQYLLYQVMAAADGKLARGVANRFPRGNQSALKLTPTLANKIRDELAEEGHLKTSKKGATITYEITPEGKRYLESLPAHPKVSLPRGALTGEVKNYCRTYLLLQLFQAPGQTLEQKVANRLGATGNKLDLNASRANSIRKELAEQGLIQIVKQGRNANLKLTPAGRVELGARGLFPDSMEFKFSGKALMALLDAVRDSTRDFEGDQPRAAGQVRAASGRQVDLSQAVLEEFDDLLREKHSRDGMVPIHEVRARVRQKYGADLARHDVLDAEIQRLRREGKVRLSAIADLQQANQDQLDDSIPGVNETLFYIEPAHEEAVAE